MKKSYFFPFIFFTFSGVAQPEDQGAEQEGEGEGGDQGDQGDQGPGGAAQDQEENTEEQELCHQVLTFNRRGWGRGTKVEVLI